MLGGPRVGRLALDGQQVGRDEDDGPYPAVRGLEQRDADPVPVGEPGDDEQPESGVLGQRVHAEVGRLGQHRVELITLLGGDAEALVLDLDDQAAADEVAAHQDRRVGRGEGGGVVEELGEEVDEVGHGRTDDGYGPRPCSTRL